MKFCVSWLKDYLDFDASNEDLTNKLTQIGLEVEEIDDAAKVYENFKVAKITQTVKHENSDKLSICAVENNKGETLQIVCGAKNVRNGLKIALAPIGSVIPVNKMVIKKAKVAGVESHGMICSAAELLLGADSDGIIEIDDRYEVGTLIADIYGINDAIIDVNITPNRGDCLGVYGIARDLAASGFGVLKNVRDVKIDPSFAGDISANISAKEGCDYALFREVRGVKNCNSPAWLKNRLEKIGVNSISAIVDVTNYVMYCLNRPMHAYDSNKIQGNIVIDFSKKGEKFTSLNDLQYGLDEGILAIKDDEKILAIAGVIGSKDSGCEIDTQNIILESAFFTKNIVADSGRRLNILSDSRYRFERGVDYKTCRQGIEFASALILEICGGEVADIKEAKVDNFDESLKVIDLDLAKVKKLIGIDVEIFKSCEILQNLGFGIENLGENKLKVVIPSFRSDIDGDADLIEEIVRIYGYEKIESAKLDLDFEKPKANIFDAIRSNLIAGGMVENINWSFCDSKIAEDFTEINEELLISNPISESLNYMRPNLIIGLLQSYKKNYARGFQDGSFFEIGRAFSGVEENLQHNVVAGIFSGKNQDQSHYGDNRDFDIFDAKKKIFDIVSILGIKGDNLILDESNPKKYCHPYKFANLKLGKNIIAYFAELHPTIAKKFDIKGNVYIFEIFVDNLAKKLIENFGSVQKKSFEFNDLQPIYRDYAFVLDREQKIGDLIKVISGCDKKLIKKVDIFDIYQGENVSEDKKSVALRVKIQPNDKSLASEEIDQISNKIISEVFSKLSAVIRS